MGKPRSQEAQWRAERDAKIFLIKEKHKGPDGSTDFSIGTPAYQEYEDWYKEHSPARVWTKEVCDDLDRYIDARAPKTDPDQPRLPQPDAELRLDLDQRRIVQEAEARQAHWLQYRAQKMESQRRINRAIDKELMYATAMAAQYVAEDETTLDVLKRREELRRAQGEAAD